MAFRDLLIAWHSRTGASEAMAQAALEGAGAAGNMLAASEARPEDFLAHRGYLFVCPENLATMSGMMKEMFDRCYYDLLGRIEARPYAVMIAAGSDGEGALRQIERIATGWRLRQVAEPVILNFNAQTKEAILAPKHLSQARRQQCADLAKGFAEGLALGIY